MIYSVDIDPKYFNELKKFEKERQVEKVFLVPGDFIQWVNRDKYIISPAGEFIKIENNTSIHTQTFLSDYPKGLLQSNINFIYKAPREAR